MAKKSNKKDRLPYHIVKDSQNLLKLKLKETIDGVTKRYGIPKKILSSGIIVVSIMVIVLVALFIGSNPDSKLSDSLDTSPRSGLVDVVIDENNQLQVQVPQITDISLNGDLNLRSANPDSEVEDVQTESSQTAVKIVSEPQIAAGNSGTQVPTMKPEEISTNLEIIYPLRRQAGVITEYGWYFHPVLEKWRYHPGVDLRCQKAEIVMAASSGEVVDITENYHEILLVTLDHGNGWTTVYGQLDKLSVNVGDKVVKGQQIGTIGQSETAIEPHLHFEIRKNGETENPEKLL